MNDKPTMEEELEKAISEAVPPAPRPTAPLASVADQMRSMAETVRNIVRDIDALQAEMTKRLDDLRRRLGSKS